jgi:hypothetical protein
MTAVLTGYAIFLFAPQVLNDGDTYSHIAAGAWILHHRSVPLTDPFSYTFYGKPWVAHEWLSELLMAVAFRLAGWSGLLTLFAATTALSLGLLARYLLRWLSPLAAAVALEVTALSMMPSWLARPHMLVLPILILWTLSILAAHGKGRPPWFALPLMLAWANMHGSFVFGIALVLPFGIEATLRSGNDWRPAAARWCAFLGCTVALTLVNPHGYDGFIFPLRLMSMKHLAAVQEWAAPDFQTTQPVEAALMALFGFCLWRGVRVPLIRLAILMVLLHLALSHTRHLMLAGVVGALVMAEPLGRAFGAAPNVALRPPAGKRWFLPTCISLALAAGLTLGRAAYPPHRTDGPTSPIAALDHVPVELLSTPVLNSYPFGAYLIFRNIRPFIDGRLDMYGDEFFANYLDMMRPNQVQLIERLRQHDIRWTILSSDSPMPAVMDNLPGWHRIYADEVAVVPARNAP